jgi:Flp pilus assembly pilin Flp
MEPAPREAVVKQELRRLAHQDMGTAVREFGLLMGVIAVVIFAAVRSGSAGDAGYRDHPVTAAARR